ncbi:RNA polymerase, sigma-24 subunit, ECF subfamily [Methylocaldum marinum]|uniref:RNA polymerase, sigma-24 subunit, ECF subfamily n=1 Tax=Methylocaldum marinum TaxID=1432792 RepID=A0A250KZ20_9GAMM|nr:sigma-70 family RNA polymerase sigma factor [Methylocaldum marinum]BBA36928.1 RNA polymerase, sigma-24 subunit, ECF subfamily [Methylocaldum marinum]
MSNFADGPEGFNRAALEHLYALYGYAVSLTHHRSDAEDLVHDTYVRAVENRQRLAEGSGLKGWLFIIMRRLWLNRLRHARSGPQFAPLDIEPVEEFSHGLNDDPEVLFLREAERRAVRAALDGLPVEFREIVVLRDLEEFSYREIAEILDCPVGTVMSRLFRAREKLKSLLVEQPSPVRVKAVPDGSR